MDGFKFSPEQLHKIYNDKVFLEFISTYFSSSGLNYVELSGEMLDDDMEISQMIFLRVLLANLGEFKDYLTLLEKNVSFSYEEKKVISGVIKGRLLINDYVQNKSMVRLPKEYPCMLKEKSLSVPENEYTVFIILEVIKLLHNYQLLLSGFSSRIKKSIEFKKLEDYFSALKSYSRKYPFSLVASSRSFRKIGNSFPSSQRKLIDVRFAKGKIRNSYAYKAIFDWYEKFAKNGFVWVDEGNTKTLINDDDFCNRLFELWCLYNLIQTLKSHFALKEIESNPIRVGMKDYVCRLENAIGDIYEFYYQKGTELYWDNSCLPKWSYIKSKKILRGIPDISVCKKGSKNTITLIDLKNRQRSDTQNTEEIYKMIGYLDNFGNYMSSKYNSPQQVILIFRNDNEPFSESLVSTNGDKIDAYSVGVSDDPTVGINQFDLICEIILSR